MEYALGLDVGGGSVTVAISGPEGVQVPQVPGVDDIGPVGGVALVLDRLGDPLPATAGDPARGAPPRPSSIAVRTTSRPRSPAR